MAAHSVFTIVAKVTLGSVAQLETVLAAIQADLDQRYARPNPPFDFRQFEKLHFASFVIFDRDTDEPFLVFENSIDGSVDEYLGEVIAGVEPAIDAIYATCEGYPAGRSRDEKLKYLKAHVRRPQVYHVGTAYRSVESIRADLQLRRDLDRDLDRLMDASRGSTSTLPPSASAIWQQLASGRSAVRGREPRWLERLKNWGIVLSLILFVTAINVLLWSTPRYLAALVSVVFALKALWLLILVGWPLNGHIRRVWLIPAAAGLGAVMGLWPRLPHLSLLVAIVLLGLQLAMWIARKLPAKKARQARGNWVIVFFVLLAAAVSGTTVWVVSDSANRIGLIVPHWVEWLALSLVAALALLAAFVGLVCVSASPRPIPRLVKDRYRLYMLGGGAGALLYWVATYQAPWLAPFLLAFISLGLLFGLWDVPLPAPILDVAQASSAKLNELKGREDSGVQNHMSVLVRIRAPHRLRSILLMAFLWTLNRIFYRTVLPDWWGSTLFGIPTVHFAQWTVLDKERHMFLSNYDHGWSVYLDDFGVGLNTGLQKIWGQSEGTPGVTDLGKFKEFVRTQMVPHQVWYRAYPTLSAEQIKNNEELRLGLVKTPTDDRAAGLLRRLSHIEPT